MAILKRTKFCLERAKEFEERARAIRTRAARQIAA
jgi:hypothetical protein